MKPEFDWSRHAKVAASHLAPMADGRLCDVVGLTLEATGIQAAIGDLFELRSMNQPIDVQVVGLRGDRTLLMPLGRTEGLRCGMPLRRRDRRAVARVGDALLGRVVDPLGRPIDGLAPPEPDAEMPLSGEMVNPLRRRSVERQFHVGVRAIDGLLSLGQGQRIGIFAGGGVGKSSLLGMMVRRAQADVAVIALIGERGREVEEFVHQTLGAEGLARSVVVAATGADVPLLRVRGAHYATSIAEYFRAQGRSVLLVMDSLTRFAMATREIGLAVGEPPATKGYTPSVFAELPKLLERAGTSEGEGSITAIYTVLVEGDDLADPIADCVRAILDGHIVLSRALAERGHFPAIDLGASVSRVMSRVASGEVLQLSRKARELLANYREVEDLVSIGAYQKGSVPRLDDALLRMPKLEMYLRQNLQEAVGPDSVVSQLKAIWEGAS